MDLGGRRRRGWGTWVERGLQRRQAVILEHVQQRRLTSVIKSQE